MPVNEIIEQLRKEHSKLAQQSTKLQQALKENTNELNRIETAMAALGEKPVTRKSSKRAATKSDVISVIESALREQSPLQHDDLLAVAKSVIADSGKSLQGFALRFKEAIQDARFVHSDEGYQLAKQYGQPTQKQGR